MGMMKKFFGGEIHEGEVTEDEYYTLGIDEAYNQIQTYKKTIPALFNYNAFCVLSDGINAKVGTLTSNIVLEMAYAEGTHEGALIATAVVLFVFILIINFCFSMINRKGSN